MKYPCVALLLGYHLGPVHRPIVLAAFSDTAISSVKILLLDEFLYSMIISCQTSIFESPQACHLAHYHAAAGPSRGPLHTEQEYCRNCTLSSFARFAHKTSVRLKLALPNQRRHPVDSCLDLVNTATDADIGQAGHVYLRRERVNSHPQGHLHLMNAP